MNKFTKCRNSIKVRIPINKVKIGDIGYRFEKNFKGFGIFEGCVVEIKTHAANHNNRRCVYTDGDSEDLSLIQLRSFKILSPKFFLNLYPTSPTLTMLIGILTLTCSTSTNFEDMVSCSFNDFAHFNNFMGDKNFGDNFFKDLS